MYGFSVLCFVTAALFNTHMEKIFMCLTGLSHFSYVVAGGGGGGQQGNFINDCSLLYK